MSSQAHQLPTNPHFYVSISPFPSPLPFTCSSFQFVFFTFFRYPPSCIPPTKSISCCKVQRAPGRRLLMWKAVEVVRPPGLSSGHGVKDSVRPRPATPFSPTLSLFPLQEGSISGWGVKFLLAGASRLFGPAEWWSILATLGAFQAEKNRSWDLPTINNSITFWHTGVWCFKSVPVNLS